MDQRHLRFVLLVWLPAALCAQAQAQSCRAPLLPNGFFVPENDQYPHGQNVTYTCFRGSKPIVDVWSVSSTCLNGNWNPKPECIDENACFPPTVANANYAHSRRDWYANGHTLRFRCHQGYEFLNNRATTKCLNGTWAPWLLCRIGHNSCGEPPHSPHAVVINHEYKELFVVDSEVFYQCEDGYTLEGGAKKMSIVCLNGNWTKPSSCQKTQPIRNEEPTESQTDEGDVPLTSRPPVAPGSSDSVSDDDTPVPIHIRHCGNRPIVLNGEVVEIRNKYLKYQCFNYYSLEGSATVHCYSNRQWSALPVCRENFCRVNTEEYPELVADGNKFVKEGAELIITCKRKRHWVTENYAVGRCRNTEITFAGCCSSLTPVKYCTGEITHIPTRHPTAYN